MTERVWRMMAGGTASVAVVFDPTAGARAAEPCARLVTPAPLPAAWAGSVKVTTALDAGTFSFGVA